MKKLKVTWLSGPWDFEESTEVASVLLPEEVGVNMVSDSDTIRFGLPNGRTLLAIPEGRLISAVQVEVDE